MPTVATQTEINYYPHREFATFTSPRGLQLTVMDVIRHAENRQRPPRYLRNEERVDILTALGRDAMQNTLSSLVDIGDRLIASQGLVLAALEYELDDLGLMGTLLRQHYRERACREFTRLVNEGPVDHLEE